MGATGALRDKQRSSLLGILLELEKHGNSEPGEATFVSRGTFGRLFEDVELAERWRAVLEKLCSLLEDMGTRVLPTIDHGRIHHFLLLWKQLAGVPEWMSRVLERLSQFK